MVLRSLKKIFINSLNLVTCIQLFTFNPFLANHSFAQGDIQTAKMKAKCLEKASGEWNASLNRCVTKEENQDLKEDYVNCASLTDKDQDKENQMRKDCFDSNAMSMIGDLNSEKETLKALQKTAEALGYTQMIIEIIAKQGEKSDCNSAKANAAAGIVGMGVDIYLAFFVEDEVNELRDRYAMKLTAKRMADKGSYESQLEAFNYVEKEQNLLIDVDKKKTIAYGVATGIYGLALLLAIYEMTPWGAAGACKMYSSSQNFADDFKSRPKGSPGAGDAPAGTLSSSKVLDGAGDTSKAMSGAGKASKSIGNATDASKAMDSASDAGKSMDNARDAGKAVDTGSPGARPDFEVDARPSPSKSGGSDTGISDSSGPNKSDSGVGDTGGGQSGSRSGGPDGGDTTPPKNRGSADATDSGSQSGSRSGGTDGGDTIPPKNRGSADAADAGKVVDDSKVADGDRGPSSIPDDVDAPSPRRSGDTDASADIGSKRNSDSSPDSTPTKQDGGEGVGDLGTKPPKGPDDIKNMKAADMDTAMKRLDNDPNLSVDQKASKRGDMIDEFASRDSYQQNVKNRKPVKDMTRAELELEASGPYRGADGKK
jgi:hypothetical protein